jgi:hypothetical protein
MVEQLTSNGFGWDGFGAAVLFGLWFAVSIPNQFSGDRFNWIKNRNVYLLIPGWTFFAPNPGVTNYRYVLRDVYADGTSSEWEEVDWCESRRLVHSIWHPGRHRTKLIVDCINGLSITIKDLDRHGVDFRSHPQSYMVSTPYLALLNIAMRARPKQAGAVSRQFAIVEQHPSTNNQSPPRLIICSPPHDLE